MHHEAFHENVVLVHIVVQESSEQWGVKLCCVIIYHEANIYPQIDTNLVHFLCFLNKWVKTDWVFSFCYAVHWFTYCPQSFSGGGLYLKVKWLLWSVYDGLLWSVCDRLLWYMGHTSKWQFHTGWGRFLTTAGYCRKWWWINKIDYNFHHRAWYMGHTSKWQFHTG